MSPDQNQPQVPGPVPVPDPLQQAQSPIEQAAPSPLGVPSDPGMVAAPAAPAPPVQPVAPFPADPTPTPQPMQPVAQPMMATPPPAPAGPLDSSQVGYVPPVMSAAPSPIMGNAGPAKGSKLKVVRIAIAVVVGLVVVSGGGFLLKDMLFAGSAVSSSDLVEETQAGITFKHPKKWTKVDLGDENKKVFGSDGAAFTEDGKSIDLADQGILVGGSDLGFDFDSLSSQEQQDSIDQFLKNYQTPSSVESENCTEVSGLKAGEVTQPNYTRTVSVEFTCDKIKNRAVKLKVKFYVALKGSTQHFVELAAIDKTWDKSGTTFDEMLSTFKPAQ